MTRGFGSVVRITSTMVIAASVSACSSDDRTVTTGTLAPVVEAAAWREASVPSIASENRPEPSGSVIVEEVRTAFDRLMVGRIHCGRRPRECAVDDLAVPGSNVHSALTRLFDERARHGIVASDRGSHRHRIGNVVMLADDRVEVRSCHTDDVVLVIGGSATYPTAIYDESLVSHWSTWTLEKIDDTWRWTDEVVDGLIHGEDLCT